MSEEIRQLSSHVGREKRGKDQPLEQLLEDWGEWRARDISCLGIGISPLERTVQPLIKSDKPQPRETRVIRPSVPKYFTRPDMNAVNMAILGLDKHHIAILVRKYEEGWQTDDFIEVLKWEKNVVYVRLSEARRAVRELPEIRKILRRK